MSAVRLGLPFPLWTFLLFAFLLQAPSAPSAATLDWTTIGLRVAIREVVTQEGPRRMPLVVAVQESGPAFHGGVQVGDAVAFLRCGSWTFNYIDRARTGTTYYRSYISVGTADLQPTTDERAVACSAELGGLISISRAPGDTRAIGQFMEIRTVSAGGGAWLHTKEKVASSQSDVRRGSADSLVKLRAQAATELRNRPCSYDVSNPYNLRAMPPVVQQVAATAAAAGIKEDLTFWRDVIDVYCSDERSGKLPSFETAILLMIRGALKPCDYRNGVEYAAIEVDYDRRQRPFSRREYDYYKDLDYLFGTLPDEAQRACLFRAIRGTIGRP